jgi:hypothetical protein
MSSLARPLLRPAVPSAPVQLGIWYDPGAERAAGSNLESRHEANTPTCLQSKTAIQTHFDRPHDGNHSDSLVTRWGCHLQILKDEILPGWCRVKTGRDRTVALDTSGRVITIRQAAAAARDRGDAITGIWGNGEGGGGAMGHRARGRANAAVSPGGGGDGVAVEGEAGGDRAGGGDGAGGVGGAAQTTAATRNAGGVVGGGGDGEGCRGAGGDRLAGRADGAVAPAVAVTV